jgi:hypothetical protein
MFSSRDISDVVDAVRETHAPDALVLDCATDFKTIPPEQAEELGLLVDSLDPVTFPAAWLPADPPDILQSYASSELTIGMAGDGSVAWTRQTDPPVVFCKPRLDGSPEGFVDFLIAEALVEVGLDVPEQMLGFFGEEYVDFAAALKDKLGPVGIYQLAVACYDAYLGLQTRDIFAEWDGPLFDAWVDAGERLSGRLEDLPSAIASGDLSVPEAAELACNGIKHAGTIPAPFDALDAAVYLDHGPAYAVEWADRVADTI